MNQNILKIDYIISLGIIIKLMKLDSRQIVYVWERESEMERERERERKRKRERKKNWAKVERLRALILRLLQITQFKNVDLSVEDFFLFQVNLDIIL